MHLLGLHGRTCRCFPSSNIGFWIVVIVLLLFRIEMFLPYCGGCRCSLKGLFNTYLVKREWAKSETSSTVVGTKRMFQGNSSVIYFACNWVRCCDFHLQSQTNTNHKHKPHVTRDTTHTQTRNTHTHKTTEV